MAKQPKTRLSLGEEELSHGSTEDHVGTLQAVLSSLGYLRGSYEPGRFCSCTERAVRRFQRFYSLKADGIVGPITKGMLERPRCGVPDLPVSPGGATPSAPFVLRGCSYQREHFTYEFLNGTGDLAQNREQEIVGQAFAAWANVANVRFDPAGPGETADFRIGWFSGSHGDGSPFDNQGGPQGNTLAHAFFPPPCGGPNAGDMHFDEAELWDELGTQPGTIRLLQVAVHEIGHLLGLSHSQDQSAIMYAFYDANHIHLAQDDIDGIRALYGVRTDTSQLRLTSDAAGILQQHGDSAHFRVSVPTTLSVSIDGPGDADFDLYVKRGAAPTVDNWDFRAYSVSADEVISFPAIAGEEYFVMVQSYSGSGPFTIRVEPGPV